ncbi:MAG: bifunctional glutamate N-acetyltransferase/amino-acid acetyltransferase ArgJ [Anaerolineae bacterium]|nr:bifunctional glutamate N-acetyltransferase/amino-acid acetyltransferase ArgJ [Anaerolineae bacterium]MDW8100077.1 bifunctional glutamate N-acetyltransferase/amino-acid acetyltransferase ArgJ [Anaerolineae bacterium]
MQKLEESTITVVPGFQAAGVAAGIKPSGDRDLALVASRAPCASAAVFTQNRFAAAPVLYDRTILCLNPTGIRAVVINSGCANACTGDQGLANARRMAELAEQALGLPSRSCLVMSTGVIGVQLPMDKIERGIREAAAALSPAGGWDAARAILTTDTRPKIASAQVEIGGVTVTLAGMCKGAGMIHPNLATMLALVCTDAAITPAALDAALRSAAGVSFNAITVDGDTSTNDTLAILANGLAGHKPIEDAASPEFAVFLKALTAVCVDLAQQIVRDGEGATKFVTVTVSGAASDDEARRAAKAIANSPLVKTALYGGDANWGRILCAVGNSGAEVDPMKVSLFFAASRAGLGRLQVVARGQPLDYSEAEAAARFAQPEIEIQVDLGIGEGRAVVWTCDLSHGYVDINGHYRT